MEACSEDRPSFTSFWRKTRDDSTARNLTFVQSDPSQSNFKAPQRDVAPPQPSKDKRRVQVRKAQVAHRQRKAKYVEQLEADIAGIRDNISNAEHARQMLRDENEAIRAQLSAAAAAAAYHHSSVPAVQVSYLSPYPHSSLSFQDLGDLDPGLGMDHFGAMKLHMDGALDGLPPFYTAESSSYSSSGVGSSLGGSPPYQAHSGGSTPYPWV